MTAILETIWATVIGGMIIVSILNGLFTIQITAMNLEMQITLNDISEDVTSVLNNGILSRVGSGVPPDSTIISSAKINEFEFKGKLTNDNTVSVIKVVQEDSTANGYPLKVYKDNSLVMGPFWLVDSLTVQYYDKDGNELSTPVTTYIDSIRYAKFDMEFFQKGIDRNNFENNLRSRIVFWRYFLNTYL
ncbi:MAG: hypothetical protein SVM86_07830 [Candidatus Cloacimonadota bacterium]|nr:hypothetical protein [Candidatus Cloacimonadota bacterium]